MGRGGRAGRLRSRLRLRMIAPALDSPMEKTMQLGMIGLGRMGGNIVRRLIAHGHEAVVFDRSADAVKAIAADGAAPLDGPRRPRRPAPGAARGVGDAALRRPDRDDDRRAGQALEARRRHHRRRQHLLEGRRAPRRRAMPPRGIDYVDVGTSGGVWGLERGYCMMIGGKVETVSTARPDLRGARPRARRHPADARPRGARPAGRARLHPCRAERRRPLRQDGP